MQINRLLEIVYVLLRQKSVTARELAERFEVSQRTIYRDIDALSMAGIPVYTEKGKGGGISLLPNFVLNKSILSEQEQVEILSALQSLSSVTTEETAQVMQKMATIFDKNLSSWLEVDFSGWGTEDAGFFDRFKYAIFERRIAEFDYYNAYGEKSKRRIEPVQLWFKTKAWYIKGFCLTKQDMRVFKLLRVKNLVVTDEHFAERDLLDMPPEPEDYNFQEITLRIEPEMAFKVYDDFNEDMIEKQPDGGYIVTAEWSQDNWLYSLVLSYGEHIEVVEPAHIREIIREKAQKIAKKHTGL